MAEFRCLPGRRVAHRLPQFLAARHAASTQRRYISAWSAYRRWCAASHLPTRSVDTVVLFIMCRALAKVKATTLRADVNAIQTFCPAAIDADPRLVSQALEAARKLSAPPKAKYPITWALLGRIYRHLRRSATSTWRRDWAFFLLGFIGFFRAQELASLRWSDLDFSDPRGVIIKLRQSKTDRFGSGAQVLLAHGTRHRFCPVQALAHLPQQSPFVFPGPNNHQSISTSTMRTRLRSTLSDILPRRQARHYSLHSLRRGGATAAAQLRVPLRLIKSHGRWRSDTVQLYTLALPDELWGVSTALQRAAP